METMINITDASSFLNYDPYTVRNFVKIGKLKAYRHGPGAHMRFKKKDLEAFLKGTTLKKSAK